MSSSNGSNLDDYKFQVLGVASSMHSNADPGRDGSIPRELPTPKVAVLNFEFWTWRFTQSQHLDANLVAVPWLCALSA